MFTPGSCGYVGNESKRDGKHPSAGPGLPQIPSYTQSSPFPERPEESQGAFKVGFPPAASGSE